MRRSAGKASYLVVGFSSGCYDSLSGGLSSGLSGGLGGNNLVLFGAVVP